MRSYHAYMKPVNETKIYGVLGVLSAVLSSFMSGVIGKLIIYFSKVLPDIKEFSTFVHSINPLLVFGIIVYVLDKILHKLLDMDISGTYDIEFMSSYTKFKEKKIAKMKIKQSLTRISIVWEIPDSSNSYSINASLEKLPDGKMKLIYTYRNEPTEGSANSQTQNIHYGTAIIEIQNGKLQGKYFTSERPSLNSEIQQTNWGIIKGTRREKSCLFKVKAFFIRK